MCESCGLDFTTSSHKKIYCSPECYRLRPGRPFPPLKWFECEICEKEILKFKAPSFDQRYCSKSCTKKAQRISGAYLEDRKCVVCGTTFQEEKGKRKDRKTCSQSCGVELAWKEGKGKMQFIKAKARPCKYCDKPFVNSDKKYQYCSLECKRNSLADARRVTKITYCEKCGKQKDNAKTKYCAACLPSVKRAHIKKIRPKNTAWRKADSQIFKKKNK